MWKRVAVYAFGVGLPLGGALGAIRGWEMGLAGAVMGVAICGVYGLCFIGAEALIAKMPPKVQRLLLRRVLPGDSVISTGPLGDGGAARSPRD